MKPLHPQHLVDRVILVGPQLIPVFRANSAIPRTSHGAEVPRLRVSDTTFLIFSNYICDLRLNMPFLLATQDVPADTPAGHHSLRMSTWAGGKTASDLQWAIQMLNREHGAEVQNAWRKMREQCIRKTYKRINARIEAGDADILKTFPVTPTESQVLRYLADLFMVGDRVIRKALLPLLPEVKISAKQSALSRLKADPRYPILARSVNTARQIAYQKGLEVSFRVTDTLSRDTDYTLPNICPVLMMPLIYEEKELRDGYRKNPFGVRVWRKNVYKGLLADNVTVMSALAARMIEGSKISKDTVIAAIGDNEIAMKAWKAWKEQHIVSGKV